MEDNGNGKTTRELTLTEILGACAAGGLFPSADDLVWLLKEIRKGKELNGTIEADVKQWGKYARDTKRAVVTAIAALGECPFDWEKEGHRNIVAQYFAGIAATRKLSPEEMEGLKSKALRFWPKKIRRWVRLTQFVYRGAVKLLPNMAVQKPSEDEEKEEEEASKILMSRIDKATSKQRIAILVTVRTIALCWVITNQFPSRLLRRIRANGDLRALQDMLRIDRRLFFDPGIQRRMRKEIGNPKSPFMRVALSAMKSKPPPLKEKAMKARFAAMVQLVSPDTDLFNEPGLRGIFDALAAGNSKGKVLRDQSLPLGSEAFQKAINRERSKLIEMLKAMGGQK